MGLGIFLSALLSLSCVEIALVQCQDKKGDVDEDVIALWMPFVNTTSEDEYYCMGVDVAWETRYITKYIPHASQKSVHHILIYGCSVPITSPNPGGAWKCLNDHPVQAACQGATKFLYAWAKDAPSLQLPKDVGFQIGSHTAVKGIFMQVHYSAIVHSDNSGISLILSSEARKYAAGIFLFAGGGQYIPPHEPVVNINVMCKYTDDIVIHPFGFRTHAHGLGTVISGWYMKPEDQATQKWTLLGKQSPQNPQAFYNMDQAHNITTGTIFGARCVYNSTERDQVTFMGPTHNDEMCNFYMMYYADRPTVREGCTDADVNLQSYRLPDSASLPLPPDQIVGHHHGHSMGPSSSDSSQSTSTSMPGMMMPEDVTAVTVPVVTPILPRRRPDLEKEQDGSNGHGREGESDGNNIVVDKKDGTKEGPILLPLMGPEVHEGMHHEEEKPMPVDGARNMKYAYVEVEHWSDALAKLNLGQISGIALDHSAEHVYIFHRRDHTWDGTSFGWDNRYLRVKDGPIAESTIVIVDKTTGAVQKQLGENMFYMPHGITIGRDGDIWVTDVALHQVIRLKDGQQSMILGVQLEPGHDGQHFCKPTMVALQSDGDFYVADGYCNSRVIKFTPDGHYISHFGTVQNRNPFSVGPIVPRPAEFGLPHDIKLSDDESVIFVADRENGRVQAFATDTSKFLRIYQVKEFGFKVFAIDVAGEMMVAVNGASGLPAESQTVQAILVNLTSGETINVINSKSSPLVNPHAVTMSGDQSCIFVVELNGKMHQFHQIGTAPVDPVTSPLSQPASSSSNSTLNFLDRLSSNPLTPKNGSYSFLMLAIFIVPGLLLCCGLGFCCMRKSQRGSTAQSKWRDVLYQYRSGNGGASKEPSAKVSASFKHSREGFRPLRQEEKFDDDSDSDEEVFSPHKSPRKNIA